MSKIVRKYVEKHIYILPALLIICLLTIFNHELLVIFWNSPFIQGWDGTSHEVIVKVYSEHIYPSLWGWTDNWFSGMPFPQYYTPLLYFIISTIYHIFFFINETLLFKIVILTMQALLPLVISKVLWNRTKNIYAVAVGMIICFFVINGNYSGLGEYGLTISSTLYAGMFSHLLGGIFFLLWIDTLPDIHTSKKRRLLSSVYLAGLALSNAHLVFPAVLVHVSSLACHYIYAINTSTQKIKWVTFYVIMKNHLQVGFLGILITSAWFLPLIINYKYLNAYPGFNPPSISQILHIIPLWFILLTSFYAIYSKRRLDLSIFTLSMILLIPTMLLQWSFSDVGLIAHVGRWLSVIFITLPLLIGLSYHSLFSNIYKKKLKNSGLLLFLTIFLLIFNFGYGHKTLNGLYTTYKNDRYEEMIVYFKEHARNGLTFVETDFTAQQPHSNVLSSSLGLFTPISAFNLRESSITGQFSTPIRDSFSIPYDTWNTISFLTHDTSFRNQSAENHITRAYEMGVESFLVKTAFAKSKLVSDPRIYLEKRFRTWSLYSFKTTPTRVKYVAHENLVGFYGDISFKKRLIDDYDWSRMQEILLYDNNFAVTMFYPNDQYIDTSTELEIASTTLISTYTYHDYDSAIARLTKISHTNKILLIESDDKLYKYLAEKNIPNIETLPRLRAHVNGRNSVRDQMIQVFQNISKNNKENNNIPVQDTSLVIEQNRIVVKTPHYTAINQPILIKSSYYPAWSNTNGSDTYMASPTYTLTFAKGPTTEMKFTTPRYVYLAWILSLSAILIIIRAYYRNRKLS